MRFAELLALAFFSACGRAATPGADERIAPAPAVVEPMFRGGLVGAWEDYGWAPRATVPGGPERFDLARHGGWVLANAHLSGRYGGLVFRYRAPGLADDVLQVRLDAPNADVFPRVPVTAAHRLALDDGWVEVFVTMAELNPHQAPFDRVVLQARRSVRHGTYVAVDQVGLTGGETAPVPTADAVATTVDLEVDCLGTTQVISPLIYGIALSPLRELQDHHQWALGATARRWGGNPSSRYNWELGNAWNTGADYFFRNVNYTQRDDWSWQTFLASEQEHHVATALTVPMLGWVARDTTAFSFPVAEFGAQQHVDPDHPQAGNGLTPAGVALDPSSPLRTSVAAPPEFIEKWVRAIRARDGTRTRSVDLYILDNEPMLWHDTQRDVHPAPVSYDELLSRTLAYGAAIRRADPEALIAGPAEWGWPGYLWSAVDAKAGFRLRPDRRAHGDVPLVPWYLAQLAAAERKTGVRVLDVLDLHYYPQGKGIGVGLDGATDAATSARRIRSTRSLWDPSWVDESWIGEPIALIPRMRTWVAENDPGLKLSIGEYSFGAERHPSGGIALAEALGRFGQNGLSSAFYWTYPPEGSPAFQAFRAFRNYDGHGAAFQPVSLPTTGATEASLFASRNAGGTVLTMVALNLSGTQTLDARVLLKGCPAMGSQRVFSYDGDPKGFAEHPVSKEKTYRLAPWSMTVIEVTLLPLRAPEAPAAEHGMHLPPT